MVLRIGPRTCTLLLVAAAGCVDVPSGIRAQFAGASAGDASNYRKGPHGTAPPVDTPDPTPPPAPEASPDGGDAAPSLAVAPAVSAPSADAGPEASP